MLHGPFDPGVVWLDINTEDVLSAAAGLRIVVTGDLVLDVWSHGSAGGLCREAPVPAVHLRSSEHVPGGAANAAANLAALGTEPQLIARTGADSQGERLVRAISERGVDVGGVSFVPGRSTHVRHRIMAGSQMLLRLDEDPAPETLHLGEQAADRMLTSAIASADAVLISDNGSGGAAGAAAAVLDAGPSPRIVVIDARDPSPYAPLEPTAATPSYLDVVSMLGLRPVEGVTQQVEQIGACAATLLARTGATSVLVTLGASGTVLLHRDLAPLHITVSAAVNRKVVGAGDVLAAALTCALAAGASAPTAARFATVAASVTAAVATGTATCSLTEVRDALRAGRKIADLAELGSLARSWREEGRRIVFTNGCFDLVHEGHLHFLEQAKRLGDVLVVGVNDDDSVRTLKGPERPVVELAGRLELLAALNFVDLVVPFSGPTAVDLIEVTRPAVFAKGGDYRGASLSEGPMLAEVGAEIHILDYIPDRSTTGLIARVVERS